MGVLSDVVNQEYERQTDRLFASADGDGTVFLQKRALDKVLNRIQLDGSLAYGYLFNIKLPEAHLRQSFDESLHQFRTIIDRFESHLECDEVIRMIEKLKARALTEDERLQYDLNFRIERLSQEQI